MKFYTRKRRMPVVIIVSLIDIFAILLIFVIVTTTFKRAQPEVVIKLPESKTAMAVAEHQDTAVLTVAPDEKMLLDNLPVTLESLKPAVMEMLAANPGRPFALNADTKAPFGLIIKVIETLRDAGVTNLPAFTEPGK